MPRSNPLAYDRFSVGFEGGRRLITTHAHKEDLSRAVREC